jgi:hypothetical protein
LTSIGQYLRIHKKELVDFIEGKYIPSEITNQDTFNNLAFELQKQFVATYKNGAVGERDAAHNVLAMALICSLWCGWLSQAKAKDNRYSQEVVDNFKKLIIDAFEIGQYYSKERS